MPVSLTHPPRVLCLLMLVVMVMTVPIGVQAQEFILEQKNDTLSYLVLHNGSSSYRWALKFPVYQFCTGDVDGDGVEDALVGVIKTTRFDPQVARRLFIFKNYKGKIRALWMGSHLGGILEDFRFVDGRVFTLQSTTDGKYVVLRHQWRKFGLGADEFLVKGVSREEALEVFEELKIEN